MATQLSLLKCLTVLCKAYQYGAAHNLLISIKLTEKYVGIYDKI